MASLDPLERGDLLDLDFVIRDNGDDGVDWDAVDVLVDWSLGIIGKDNTIPDKVGVAARDGAVILRGWVGDNERSEAVSAGAGAFWDGDKAGSCVVNALHADKSEAGERFGFYL